MSHALIIDDNMIVSHAIQAGLAPLGFGSFDCVWTETQAVESADLRPPDLLVVGDSLAEGSAIDAVRRITGDHCVPVLMVTADRYRARNRLPADALLDGPFLIDELEAALHSAHSHR
jgi:DNA-binding response OmpR family regulator